MIILDKNNKLIEIDSNRKQLELNNGFLGFYKNAYFSTSWNIFNTTFGKDIYILDYINQHFIQVALDKRTKSN